MGLKANNGAFETDPPYPIEDKVLRKGTKLNSVELAKSHKTKRWKYTYNANDKHDKEIYEGPFSMYKYIVTNGKPLVSQEYEVTQDLILANKKERVDEFINLYKDHKLSTYKALKNTQSTLIRNNIGSKDVQQLKLRKLKSDDDFKKAYEIWNHAMENISQFAATKRYGRIMASKYDGMIDDNNQGVYNDAHDPIIIFNANKHLQATTKVREIDPELIISNTDKVDARMLKEHGQRVML